MCKGSCRRTPTEGLAECLRWHTVLPHRITERRLVADPATITTPGIRYQQYGCVPSIPPAWPCHAIPPLHKGGFFFAQVDTTGKGKERNGSSVTLGPVAGRAQCLGRHIFFAQVDTTGPSSHNPHGCSVALGPYRAPPGARKRSGKNLVFPRDPAAAPADYLQVISALCRNNTPPKLQKIPRRFPPGDFLQQHPPQRMLWITRFPVWRRRAGRWDRSPRPDPPARLFWPAPPDPDL